MITSSTGGVAIIDIKTKDVIFYAKIGNPHSIEELPNNVIAVAASNHDEGSCVALYNKNESNSAPFFKDVYYGAHGLYWDKKKKILFALAEQQFRTYKILADKTQNIKLKKIKEWTLPAIGGHDLVPNPNNNSELIITINSGVWKFDTNSETFSVFEPLEKVENIKGINLLKDRIIYIKAEEKWWSHHIYLTNPEQTLSFPMINLYKARWFNDLYINNLR